MRGGNAIKAILEGLREAAVGKTGLDLDGRPRNYFREILYQFSSLRAKAGRAGGFRTGVLNTRTKTRSQVCCCQTMNCRSGHSRVHFFVSRD